MQFRLAEGKRRRMRTAMRDGASRGDGRMIDDVVRNADISDRKGFGDFVEAEKGALGRRPSNNFTWDELIDFAEHFKGGAR